ncbi:MAG: PulJ/GspJ family protein [Caulobacteraceae bacterium]
MSRSAGFTLVEMLASLAIIAMISLMLFSGVGSGRRVWERLESNRASGESVETAQALLRNSLERAFAATRFDASAPYTDFTGKQAAISFFAPTKTGDSTAAHTRQQVELNARGELLAVRQDADGRAIGQQVLITGVQAVDFAYYGATTFAPQPQWRTLWNQQAAPPELIRIRASFFPGDRRRWPDLLIKPAATIDVACVLDRATHKCRGRA